MSRLLLFTNDYPYRTGDAVFVRSEIDALAERFDTVVVFCHARDTSSGMVDLPSNVRFGGNLFRMPRAARLAALLRLRAVVDLVRATWLEARSGRLRHHVRLFFMGASVGIAQAGHPLVRQAVREDQDTVAYAFWGMGGGLALAWLHGVRSRAVRLHRYDLYDSEAARGYLPFRPFLFDRADRVLVISDDGRRYLARTHGGEALQAKTVVSRLGVFGPDAIERPPAGDEVVVVSCSAVTAVKRVDRILAAVVQLAGDASRRPVRWVHFGAGPLLAELRSAAATLPAGLTVELRGQTDNADIHRYYAEHRVDAFLNLSSSEGVPVSIMEALAYDIPVVATAVGGTPEVVGDEWGSGELVEVDASPGEVADTVRRVLESTHYHPRLLWERKLDARVTGAQTARIVHDLLANGDE